MSSAYGASMCTQLSLFEAPAVPADRLSILMADEAANFIWWCRNGNRDMCAAVLVNRFNLDRADARALVEAA